MVDAVKQAVGRYWGDMAATFDDQALHSVATDAERRAWERVIGLLAPAGRVLDVLDVGCGTGFLALLFAQRGHRVTGTDIAPEMVARARDKARAAGLSATFEQGDAEAIAADDGAYDLVVSRHLLWTLPHPREALAEWTRVTRPGGRVAAVDGQWDVAPAPRRPDTENESMRRLYGDAVIASLPNFGGAPADRVAQGMRDAGLQQVKIDQLEDLVAAQTARLTAMGKRPEVFVRYLVWGERPA